MSHLMTPNLTGEPREQLKSLESADLTDGSREIFPEDKPPKSKSSFPSGKLLAVNFSSAFWIFDSRIEPWGEHPEAVAGFLEMTIHVQVELLEAVELVEKQIRLVFTCEPNVHRRCQISFSLMSCHSPLVPRPYAAANFFGITNQIKNRQILSTPNLFARRNELNDLDAHCAAGVRLFVVTQAVTQFIAPIAALIRRLTQTVDLWLRRTGRSWILIQLLKLRFKHQCTHLNSVSKVVGKRFDFQVSAKKRRSMHSREFRSNWKFVSLMGDFLTVTPLKSSNFQRE